MEPLGAAAIGRGTMFDFAASTKRCMYRTMDDWETRLLRIATLQAGVLATMREGIAHEYDTRLTLDVLVREAADERFRMARQHFRDAEALHASAIPSYRGAISRYYYAFYHAGRAASFIARKGDDFEQHSALWRGIPDELDDVDNWRNKLKSARLLRNQADYDPYPTDPGFWRAEATKLRSNTESFMTSVMRYLKTNGGTP